MSERRWRILSLLERLGRGEVTPGEVAASLGRSKRQVQRMRKRFASSGVAGLVHGNAGRSPKHRTSQEVREGVLMLRRGKYDGFNDQHFTEKLVGLELTRETVRRILRSAGVASPRKRRAPKHRRRRERKAQAGQMILWDGSDHDWLEGRGPRLCLMGAIDDATGEVLPGAHFTEEESTVGYLRVLRDILREKGILDEYRQAHNKRFAVAPQDTQPAWRKAPTDHTQLLDLCALHYVRKVYKNHTVRLHGRVINIRKRSNAAHETYAGKEVVVKHLLSGDYRVFHGEECIAWASGSRPKPSTGSNKNNDKDEQLG